MFLKANVRSSNTVGSQYARTFLAPEFYLRSSCSRLGDQRMQPLTSPTRTYFLARTEIVLSVKYAPALSSSLDRSTCARIRFDAGEPGLSSVLHIPGCAGSRGTSLAIFCFLSFRGCILSPLVCLSSCCKSCTALPHLAFPLNALNEDLSWRGVSLFRARTHVSFCLSHAPTHSCTRSFILLTWYFARCVRLMLALACVRAQTSPRTELCDHMYL